MSYAVLEPGIVGGVHAEDRQGDCKQKTLDDDHGAVRGFLLTADGAP
jgi:hypothetical protein